MGMAAGQADKFRQRRETGISFHPCHPEKAATAIKKAVEVIHGQVSLKKQYRSAVDSSPRLKFHAPPPIFLSFNNHGFSLHHPDQAVKHLGGDVITAGGKEAARMLLRAAE
jgi:hypothetical protein